MDEKFLQTLASCDRRVTELCEHPVVCAITRWGVQLTVQGMAQIARFAEIAVKDDGTNHKPLRVQAIWDGVHFFAVGTEQGFIEAGIFDLVAKQGVPNG